MQARAERRSSIDGDCLCVLSRGLNRIRALRFDQYGGSYNDRSTVSGKTKSMHA